MSRFTIARLGAIAAGAALALSAVALPAAPASAHDRLLGSDPAAGAVLQEAPEQIALEFSGNLMTLGDSSTLVVVADAEGRDWVASAPVVEGARVTVPLSAEMAGGSYEVSWQVVSEDGHPISGVIPFTVDAPAAPSEAPTEEPAPDATQGEEPEESDEVTTVASEDDGPNWALVIGIAVVIVVIGAVAFILMRRKPSGVEPR